MSTTPDDAPALLSPGALYVSHDGEWTEIGRADGPIQFGTVSLPEEIFEPPFAPGPRSLTVDFKLDRPQARRLKRWILSCINPGPLCINGQEYRRRQQARRRRDR